MKTKDLKNYHHPMTRRLKKERTEAGSWLLFLRLNAGLSQMETVVGVNSIQLATELTQTTYSRWEITGKVQAEYIPALCNVFRVSLETFFRVSLYRQTNEYVPIQLPDDLKPNNIKANPRLQWGRKSFYDPLGKPNEGITPKSDHASDNQQTR